MNEIPSTISTTDSRGFTRQASGPLTEIPKEMYHGQLGAANATLYTAPATNAVENALQVRPSARVEEFWIVNNDVVARTITLYKVESGGAAAANRMILSGRDDPAERGLPGHREVRHGARRDAAGLRVSCERDHALRHRR